MVYKRFFLSQRDEKNFHLEFLFFSFRLDSEEFEENLETTDLLETVTGHPSQNKAIKQEENRVKEKETKKDQEKSLMQQVKRY